MPAASVATVRQKTVTLPALADGSRSLRLGGVAVGLNDNDFVAIANRGAALDYQIAVTDLDVGRVLLTHVGVVPDASAAGNQTKLVISQLT
jgi:hypothetical protein